MPEDKPASEAAALSYEESRSAPRVVASGRGEVARRIVELAREAGLPVRRDPALAEALARLELDLEIPPDLYAAVAEALAWAYRLDIEAARPPGATPPR
ncbi:MAG: EscU/YscU/HrcU family type III secretion system export apparatus switch protein [Thermoleophilaceae bacterium]